MKTERSTLLPQTVVLLVLFVLAPNFASAQSAPPKGSCSPTPTPSAATPPKAEGARTSTAAAPAPAAGGIRIQLLEGRNPFVGVRLYLLRQSAFGSGLDWARMPRRSDYLKGASPKLIEFLDKHDCDSLFCPEIDGELAEAVKNIDEFKQAYDAGLKKYRGNAKLAQKWLLVNLPPGVRAARSEYFRQKRAWVKRAAASTKAVASFMTDDRGWAIFPESELPAGAGDYYVSNLFPLGEGGPVWDCRVSTRPPNPRLLFSSTYTLTPPAGKAAPASP